MSIERKDQDANNLGYPDTAYGVVQAEELGYKGSAVGTGSGQTQEYVSEYVYDLENLPSSYTSESDAGLTTLPVGAVVIKTEGQVLETLSGGTAVNVGLSQPDGTVIDADGLIAAWGDTASGSYVDGTGAEIEVPQTTEAQVVPNTDHTAGKLRILVTYRVLETL